MNLKIKDSPQFLPGEWRWVLLNKPKNALPQTKKAKIFSQKQNPHKWPTKKTRNDNNEELCLLKYLVNIIEPKNAAENQNPKNTPLISVCKYGKSDLLGDSPDQNVAFPPMNHSIRPMHCPHM